MALVNQTILTKTAKETEKLGEKIAKDLLKKGPNETATCVCLEGNLGAGKTTLAKGFAQGLGIKDIITSPTFVILKKFKIPNYKLSTIYYQLFYHIDAYRLQNSEDAMVLGLKEVLSDPRNIVLIEWPDRLKNILPSRGLKVKARYQASKGKNTRAIDIINNLCYN
ncbi:MAG: tRNA (adenosine(37)-N6)-threonylcarbamoyltransferase complex ATPase subunit type 1 TsaE [bacterium]|nr:tRNA (adenosine(37)-N6)-threonylcarbamoyltransferase complex ATPase subunit type 1 TsaE [bacterium]